MISPNLLYELLRFIFSYLGKDKKIKIIKKHSYFIKKRSYFIVTLFIKAFSALQPNLVYLKYI